MNNRNLILAVFLATLFGAFISGSVIFYHLKDLQPPDPGLSISEKQQPVQLAGFSDSLFIVPKGLNFIHAAQRVTAGVVHIRVGYSGSFSINSLDGFYRNQTQSSGSGVIISDDGYIATNNHVVENANQIEVVLNDNRSYFAKIVGTDPTTDLALLKISENKLNYVPYGDSDKVVPGQWVLAIGNPFDLNSTVTAGIVSAKARNIGILRDKSNLQIESFIQTDAAVNPGNSGGALVNLKGELIGINTAIATSTGSYAGYSFAVPVTLVRKIMDDLLEFGSVQRGLLGISINDVNAQLAEARDLGVVNGVFVVNVNRNSSADRAGLQEGDVITGINGKNVNNVSELQELVARNRPGYRIRVTYLRDQNKNTLIATLQNTEGNTEIRPVVFREELEGARFENLKMRELGEYNLDGGVKIILLNEGKWEKSGITEGFIITKIDKVPISNLEDLNQVLDNKRGGILVEGVTPDGERGVFGIDW